MKLKLSDDKFIRQALAERTEVNLAPTLENVDVSALRGLGDRSGTSLSATLGRSVQASARGDAQKYEPVSFTNPENGRRVYGWLVEATHSGLARVEMGQGEYALVEPSELKRLGKNKKAAKDLKEKLRAVLSTFGNDADGVRADFHVAAGLIPVNGASEDELNGDYAAQLSYAATVGQPTAMELHAFTSAEFPGGQVTEVDMSMPGKVGLVLRFADEREAEFESASGGEVLETLDPEEDVKEEKEPWQKPWEKDKIASIWSDAEPQVRTAQAVRTVRDFAHALTSKPAGHEVSQQLINSALTKGDPDAQARMLQVAIPTVQRSDPALWTNASNWAVRQNIVPAPKQVGVNKVTPVQPEQPYAQDPGNYQNQQNPGQAPQVAPTPSGEQADRLRQLPGAPLRPMNASKRVAAFDKASAPVPLQEYNLPASQREIMKSMHFSRLAKRGAYIVGTVKWDSKLFKNAPDGAAKQAVISFVKSYATRGPGGAQDLGLIGRVHVTKCGPSSAEVQFQASGIGSTPSEVVKPGEPAPVLEYLPNRGED